MALSLVNNISSLQAQNALTHTSSALATSLQRLSTGLRINSGADDPAGLVISEHQQSQISGLQQAITNTNNAVSVVQTASGALSQISSLLTQIRGLAVESANSGVNDPNTLAANQAQINNALSTINSIAANTQFGTENLLDGSAGTTGTLAGANNANLTNIQTSGSTNAGVFTVAILTQGTGGTVTGQAPVAAVPPPTLAAPGSITLTGGGLTSALTVQLATGDDINAAANKIQAALNSATGFNGGPGKFQVSVTGGAINITSNVLGSTAITAISDSAATAAVTSFDTGAGDTGTAGVALQASINGEAATVSAGPSGLNNVITASTGANNASGLSATVTVTAGQTVAAGAGADTSINVTGQASVFQIGANENQTASLSIQNVSASNLGVDVIGLSNPNTTSLAQINVTTASGAQDAIAVVDQAINDVSNLDGALGAFQDNTLQATATNLQTSLQNTTAAESSIADTDFAAETASYTQQQVLLQAGTTVLYNANQTSQLVLNLLK